MRLPTLLAALALSASLLAGCTSPDEPGATPSPGPQAPSGGGNGGAGGGQAPPGDAAPAPVDDAGDVAGPFEKSWRLEVPRVGFREAHVAFALAGAQAGAPPTARVQLSLLDPDGAVLKTAAAGLGAESDSISWTLRAADLPAAGTYTLQAATLPAAPGGLPSAGVAKYTLHAEVLY